MSTRREGRPTRKGGQGSPSRPNRAERNKPSEYEVQIVLAHYKYSNYLWACKVVGIPPKSEACWNELREKSKLDPRYRASSRDGIPGRSDG